MTMTPGSTKMPKMFLSLSPRVTLVSMITAQTAKRTVDAQEWFWNHRLIGVIVVLRCSWSEIMKSKTNKT